MPKKSPYTELEQFRLDGLHELLSTPDATISTRQRNAMREQVLAIEREARAREVKAEEEKKARREKRARKSEAKVANKEKDEDVDPAPRFEDFDGDEYGFRKAQEMFRLALDEKAANKILDSPHASLKAREDAKRLLKQVGRRRHAIEPHRWRADGWEFKNKVGPTSEPESDEARARRWRIERERVEKANREAQEHLLGSQPVVESVQAQEIIDVHPPPKPVRHFAYRLPDGFRFWPDDFSPAQDVVPWLPVYPVPPPPNYNDGDERIPTGLIFDFVLNAWKPS